MTLNLPLPSPQTDGLKAQLDIVVDQLQEGLELGEKSHRTEQAFYPDGWLLLGGVGTVNKTVAPNWPDGQRVSVEAVPNRDICLDQDGRPVLGFVVGGQLLDGQVCLHLNLATSIYEKLAATCGHTFIWPNGKVRLSLELIFTSKAPEAAINALPPKGPWWYVSDLKVCAKCDRNS